MDKELSGIGDSEVAGQRVVDKLVRVYSKKGKEEYILIHVEVQGYKEKEFAKRMYVYFARIMHKFGKPVAAIAILTDANSNFHPSEYQYNCLGTSLVYRFFSYKISKQKENELMENENPFSIVILTAKEALNNKGADDEVLWKFKRQLIENLIKRDIPGEKIRKLINFIKLYVRFKDKENDQRFHNEIIQLTDKPEIMGIDEMLEEHFKSEGREEGIEKGIEKGREKERMEIITSLLKKGRMSVKEIAETISVSEAAVLKVQELVNQ